MTVNLVLSNGRVLRCDDFVAKFWVFGARACCGKLAHVCGGRRPGVNFELVVIVSSWLVNDCKPVACLLW